MVPFVTNQTQPASAFETFWGLGERGWWKQYIEKTVHHFGPHVFDEGLHAKHLAEPGFLDSLKKAALFAGEHFGEKPTKEFYKELHRRACAHFDGVSTEMKADQAGVFRSVLCNWGYDLKNWNKETQEDYAVIEICESNTPKFKHRFPEEYESLLKQYPESKARVEKLEKNWADNVQILQQHLSNITKALNLSVPITQVSIREKRDIRVSNFYCENCEEQLELVVDLIFLRFNNAIEAINTDKQLSNKEFLDKKFDCIANLFQLLEWFHPFRDGQGRTDLVLLSKLLSEHGSNPAILENPWIYSGCCDLTSWVKYLKEGTEAWKMETSK